MPPSAARTPRSWYSEQNQGICIIHYSRCGTVRRHRCPGHCGRTSMSKKPKVNKTKQRKENQHNLLLFSFKAAAYYPKLVLLAAALPCFVSALCSLIPCVQFVMTSSCHSISCLWRLFTVCTVRNVSSLSCYWTLFGLTGAFMFVKTLVNIKIHSVHIILLKCFTAFLILNVSA